MSMLFNAKRQNTNRQLTPMTKTPNLVEIQGLVAAAGDRPGQTFEVPIILGDTSARVYHIAILCRRRQGESALTWWLYQGKEFEERAQLWTYNTQDIAIIHNMLLCSLDDQTSAGPERLDTYAAKSMPTTPEAAAAKAMAPPAPLKDSFYGNLSNLPIEGVLQTLASSKLTGALKIHRQGSNAIIFLSDGKLVHCQLDDTTGDTAFLEVSLWREGPFEFVQGLEAPTNSITRPLHGLLLESATLADYSEFLTKKFIQFDSFLLSNNVSQSEYIAALTGCVPVDPSRQLQVFAAAANGTARVSDIISTLSLKRAEWSPILFNLCKANLIKAIERPLSPPDAAKANISGFKLPDVTVLRKSLTRGDTGLLSYIAFIYFLEQEQIRYETFRRSFSIVVMRVIEKRDDCIQPLSAEQMQQLALRLSAMKRKSDLLCHFESLDLALLLPEADEEGCRFVLSRIREQVLAKPLGPSQQSPLILALGSATAAPGSDGAEVLVGLALQRRSENLDKQLDA